jgi:glucans biosynthesis protein C
MFLLGPVTEYFVAHSWNSTEPTSFANEWIKHIRNGQFLQENGPLWFCLALLIFSVCYAAVHRRGALNDGTAGPAPGNARIACVALIMAAATFVVRLAFPEGMSVLNMQLADFPQYVLLFVGGTHAARGGWLLKLDYASGIRWLTIGLSVGFVVWLAALIGGGMLDGNARAYGGGWHWQAAAINVWESFTCIAISFGFVVVFSRRFNSQGRFATFMSDNAFSVYVFHPPLVILGARVLHGVAWAPLLKFAVLTIGASTAAFIFSAAVFRKIPGLRTIV